MKIKDILGRTLDIEVVVQGPHGWMVPVGYEIEGLQTRFIRLPHGPFALRVMAQETAEFIMHLNGEVIHAQTVPGKTIAFIEKSSEGKPFMFEALPEGAVDVCDNVPKGDEETPKAPRGHGLLFVVARFAREQSQYSQPPQMEYTFPFQMNTGADHDKLAAGNLRRMVQPEGPPNLNDLTSREPGPPEMERHCITCGRDH